MNILTIVAIVYLLIVALLGRKRGFFKSVLSVTAVILAMLLTYYCSPRISTFICKNTDLDDMLAKRLEIVLEKQIKTSVDQMITDEAMGSRSEQSELLDSSMLSSYMKELLKSNSNKEYYEAFGVQSFVSYIAMYLSQIIVNMLSYLVSYIIVWIVLRMLMKTMDFITALPILREIDEVGGFLLGLTKGLLIMTLVCLLIIVFSNTEYGAILMKQIEESYLLNLFYEKNPLIQFLTDITMQVFEK